jgi:parallel beta-helix repeat protein
MKTRIFLPLLSIILLLFSSHPFNDASASTITVDSLSGETDGSCSDIDCSLGDAITEANTNPGSDTIEFDVSPVLCMDGICYIYLVDELPWLSGGGTTIDGYTQPGATRATAAKTAVIKIEINGINLTENCDNVLDLKCNALLITSSNNVVEGLSIHSFHNNGIAIGNGSAGVSADNNVIKGNYIGVSSHGIVAPGNGLDGVFIGFNAQNNTIGGITPATRNIISGNNIGVEICPLTASYTSAGNMINGNYIGTDHTGTASLGNLLDGVRIYGGAHDNTIGGSNEAKRNIIASSGRSGVRIVGLGTNNNTVSGNNIGTNKVASSALPNVSEGVYIGQQAQLNTVGGDSVGERNIISGNLDSGVILTGTNTTSNTVSGNYIGLSLLGLTGLGNGGYGVYVYNASHNLIGGDMAGERNIISGNHDGIVLFGSEAHENVITGNYIGTNVNGNAPIPNTYMGIGLSEDVHDNHIGGSTGEGNLVSGNGGEGMFLLRASQNEILGNYIGTDATGMLALPNLAEGVKLVGADQNTIGGPTPETFNVISGNEDSGVYLSGHSNNNTISGNLIGLKADMSAGLPNDGSGIYFSEAPDNVIGGTIVDHSLNYICANDGDGVHLEGPDSTGNEISGNVIGKNGTGNNGVGIVLSDGAHDNTIGGEDDQGNYIAYNHQYGMVIIDDGSDNNVITENVIYHNTLDGVQIWDGEDNRIGPDNIIGLNGADGIGMGGSGTIGNVVTENGIGDNSSMGIDLEDGANGGILAPQITGQTPTTVSGTACASCTIELFANGDMDGEGSYYLATTVADGSGHFSFAISWLPYSYLTATATDAILGTSEFSEVFASIYNYLLLPLVAR